MTETLTLKFFARLRDQTGTAEIDLPAQEVTDTDQLVPWLCRHYPHWEAALQGPLMTAVNHTMVNRCVALKAGDEVALFPPVTGG